MKIVEYDRLTVFTSSVFIGEESFGVSILLNNRNEDAGAHSEGGVRIMLNFEQACRLSKVLGAAVELGRATLK